MVTEVHAQFIDLLIGRGLRLRALEMLDEALKLEADYGSDAALAIDGMLAGAAHTERIAFMPNKDISDGAEGSIDAVTSHYTNMGDLRGWSVPCNLCKTQTDLTDAAQFRLSFLESGRTVMLSACLCMACRTALVEFLKTRGV